MFSAHTLKVKDSKDCCVVVVHSSKTKNKGEPDEIPIVKSNDKSICAYRWLRMLLKKAKEKVKTICSRLRPFLG